MAKINKNGQQMEKGEKLRTIDLKIWEIERKKRVKNGEKLSLVAENWKKFRKNYKYEQKYHKKIVAKNWQKIPKVKKKKKNGKQLRKKFRKLDKNW